MRLDKRLIWVSIWLLLYATPGFGQDTLAHRKLDYYLEVGLVNSPLLKDNINAITLNRLDSLLNIAINKPYVQAIGQYLYAPAGANWGYDQNTTNGGAYTGLIQANRNLLYRRNLRIQNNLNAAHRDSLVNTVRINQNDLQKAIVDLYLTVYQDYQQMVIFGDLYQIFSRQNEVLKELLRKALFNQSDYLTFRVDWQQSEVNFEGAKVQFLQDMLTLNTFCNIPETGLVYLEKPALTPLARFTLDNNPYFLRYRYDSVIVERNRRVVDIFYRPSLDVVANAGTNAISSDLITRRFGYSLGLNFIMPIYNGNQRKLQYQKFDVTQLTIQNYRNQYLNRFNLQLRTVNEQLRVNQNLITITERQNTDVENLLTISQARLYRGDISAIDYLLIVQRYLNIKLSLNQLTVQRQRFINTFNYRNF
ncbi:TolC family protein [Spirosoma luteum]|uniref:TolC family protein n=1 Tax=Spirosoma luteum TaxID=431553 RepID=UPI00037D427F|nr:TolC family protein [Spirosoma luteum]